MDADVKPEPATGSRLTKCDRCVAWAIDSVKFEKGELFFCGHHMAQYLATLKARVTL